MPLPTKNRKIEPGYQPANVAADGDPTAAAAGPNDAAVGAAGSPVDTAAAGATVGAAPSISRRLAAATVHANGPTAGPSPDPPEANHANRFEPTPLTPPAAAAARGAVITGAAAAAEAATSTTGSATGTSESLADATESDNSGTDPATSGTRGVTTGASTTPGAEGTTTAPATPEREPRTREFTAPTPASTPAPRAPGPRAPVAAESAVESLSSWEPTAELPCEPEPTAEPPRPDRAPRAGAAVDAPAADASDPDPLDPAEPVVSANATGTAATADPTPNATANAPTRPTTRANVDTVRSRSAPRPYSMVRTRFPAAWRWRRVGWFESVADTDGSYLLTVWNGSRATLTNVATSRKNFQAIRAPGAADCWANSPSTIETADGRSPCWTSRPTKKFTGGLTS